MKKIFLPLIAFSLTAINAYTQEEKPKVSLCTVEESSVIGDQVKQLLQETQNHVSEIVHKDPAVMENLTALISLLSNAFNKEKSFTVQEVEEICNGIEFAAEKHRFQTRKNKEKTPYISHPLGVAYNLMQIGEVREPVLIVGALLHDTIEDTKTSLKEIEKQFGKEVADLVKEVSNDKTLAKEARKRLQVINAPHQSKGATQIKLADKLYNLDDLRKNPPQDWSQQRIDQYYEWTHSVVDRLPEVNQKLRAAVEQSIDAYWENQIPTK